MILHGAWLIEDKSLPRGRLFLWAEEIKPQLSQKRYKKHIHPFAISSAAIHQKLKTPAAVCQQILTLPSSPAFPIPSSLLDVGIKEKTTLEDWETPGVMIDKGFIPFLLSLDEEQLKENKVLLGDDLVFLRNLTRFGIELLVRQHFLPSLEHSEETKIACFWKPVFVADDEIKILSYFKDYVPDGVRCISSENGLFSKEFHIQHFLTVLVNQAIRIFTDYHIMGIFTGEDFPFQKKDYLLEVPRKKLLYDQYIDWSSSLTVRQKEEPYRTCFRLEPPDENNKPWNLRFLLQSTEDPSLTFDFNDVWQGEKIALNQRLTNMLLADLGVAMRLFPPIEKALSAPKPDSLKIDTTRAYSFLLESAPILMECGFGVFVPSFWNMEDRRGTPVRVRVKAAPSGSGDLVGLSRMVEFDWQVALFPTSSQDFVAECSCPDWANPCKHIAAVYYIVAEAFDREPFLIFYLRGKKKDRLLQILHKEAGIVHQEEKKEGKEKEAVEPLSDKPEEFWKMKKRLEHHFSLKPAPLNAAILHRLGVPQFWPGTEKEFYARMEGVYKRISASALNLAFTSEERDKT